MAELQQNHCFEPSSSVLSSPIKLKPWFTSRFLLRIDTASKGAGGRGRDKENEQKHVSWTNQSSYWTKLAKKKSAILCFYNHVVHFIFTKNVSFGFSQSPWLLEVFWIGTNNNTKRTRSTSIIFPEGSRFKYLDDKEPNLPIWWFFSYCTIKRKDQMNKTCWTKESWFRRLHNQHDWLFSQVWLSSPGLFLTVRRTRFLTHVMQDGRGDDDLRTKPWFQSQNFKKVIFHLFFITSKKNSFPIPRAAA